MAKNQETVEEARRRFLNANHPDKFPGASPELLRELTEVCAEQNEFLDRHKWMIYVKRVKPRELPAGE